MSLNNPKLRFSTLGILVWCSFCGKYDVEYSFHNITSEDMYSTLSEICLRYDRLDVMNDI